VGIVDLIRFESVLYPPFWGVSTVNSWCRGEAATFCNGSRSLKRSYPDWHYLQGRVPIARSCRLVILPCALQLNQHRTAYITKLAGPEIRTHSAACTSTLSPISRCVRQRLRYWLVCFRSRERRGPRIDRNWRKACDRASFSSL